MPAAVVVVVPAFILPAQAVQAAAVRAAQTHPALQAQPTPAAAAGVRAAVTLPTQAVLVGQAWLFCLSLLVTTPALLLAHQQSLQAV
jgi:hypothetical protein